MIQRGIVGKLYMGQGRLRHNGARTELSRLAIRVGRIGPFAKLATWLSHQPPYPEGVNENNARADV